MQARSAGRRRYIEAVFNANEPEPHMKRALCLTVLLSTTAALLSACIVVPPRAAAAPPTTITTTATDTALPVNQTSGEPT
ncbi:hypothetical protein AWV80_19060 [Cupriavidus sp. UYMU48A]|nr:hypothetical protein AWV80_19060 [Cupriavidus sp. UYMU48A]